jgi:hypothetical protein
MNRDYMPFFPQWLLRIRILYTLQLIIFVTELNVSSSIMSRREGLLRILPNNRHSWWWVFATNRDIISKEKCCYKVDLCVRITSSSDHMQTNWDRQLTYSQLLHVDTLPYATPWSSDCTNPYKKMQPTPLLGILYATCVEVVMGWRREQFGHELMYMVARFLIWWRCSENYLFLQPAGRTVSYCTVLTVSCDFEPAMIYMHLCVSITCANRQPTVDCQCQLFARCCS